MRLWPALLVLCACGDGSHLAGEFRMTPKGAGFVLTNLDGGAPLLTSYAAGTDAYAPLAVRTASTRYQMSFGSFLIVDGDQPWTTAAKFGLSAQKDGTLLGTWKDATGAALATAQVSSPADGVLQIQLTASDPTVNELSLAFDCDSTDHFLGFGEQSDAIDHFGHKVPIWTSEHGIGKTSSDDPPADWIIEGARHSSNMGLPTWLSQRGYIAALDSSRRSIFELCSAQSDAFRFEVWGPSTTLWLFYGPSPATALERATGQLFGRPVRPPTLAFAPWNDAIFGSANVRAVAQIIRDAGFPSSVIWTEDFRGGGDVAGQGYRIAENWDLDPTLYPDAGELAGELHDAGFAWLAYFNSFIIQGADEFGEALDGGYFVQSPDGGPYLFGYPTGNPAGLVDLTSPTASEGIEKHMRAVLDLGFDGWMADFAEWLPADAVLASGADPLVEHDLYPLEWAKLNAAVLAERASDGRQRLFFARSGWYGTPSQVPVFWPADQRTDFETDDGMPTVVPMALGLGLVGVSTFGSDVAGYQSLSNPTSTQELFFRWTELGALSPVMRTHHGLDARNNWRFDQDAPTLAHFSRWATFHFGLLPYLDGASAIAESTGLPLMRALVLTHPEDPASWTLFDEYQLGPSLLVAPVMTAGATTRTLHLPPGHWFPFGGGMATDGPADVTVPAPVSEIPLFAPAGALIPTLPPGAQTVLPAGTGVTTVDSVSNQRVLFLFAGAAGSFAERDGTTYTLAQTSDSGAFAENGVALPACGNPTQRGCVDSTSSPPRVRLSAQGPLTFNGNALSIQGPARTVDVVVSQ